MVTLDGAIVNVALPSIQRDRHVSASSVQWVFSAYPFAHGGLLLLADGELMTVDAAALASGRLRE